MYEIYVMQRPFSLRLNMTTHRIGYSRVSTTDQNPESQQDALSKAGVDRIFIDHFTGTKSSRPEWDKARDAMREGDTLVITRLDRLGRSTKDLLEIAEALAQKGVNLQATEQSIDTTTPEGKLFFTMIAAFAEFEHSMMRARTLDGLAAGRARGRTGGRPAKLSQRKVNDVRERYEAGESVQEIANYFQVSRPTIYRALDAPSS